MQTCHTALAVQHLSYQLNNGNNLFTDLNFVLPNCCQGLTGRNGIGKSVLARLLAGEIRSYAGQIQRYCTIGFLPQQLNPPPNSTIAEVLGVSAILLALEHIEGGSDAPEDFEIVDDNWLIKDVLLDALDQFELTHSLATPVASLSGGQQTRLALLKLERENSDFLILDEPGNHLDAAGRAWLVNWLTKDRGAGSLVISHDRQLLSAVDSIWELSALGIEHFGGNYEFYLQQRKLQREAAQVSMEKARTEAKKTKVKNRKIQERHAQKAAKGQRDRRDCNQSKLVLDAAKERSSKTESRLKDSLQAKLQQARTSAEYQRQKVEALTSQSLTVTSPCITHGRLLELKDLVLPFILQPQQPFSLLVNAGQRIAITGPNGSGKSTLLAVVMGLLQPLSGEVPLRRGKFAMLDQNCSLLDGSQSVLDNLQSLTQGWEDYLFRTTLAQLRFSSEQAHMPVSQLSGGERMKVAIAGLLSGPKAPDLLVLDEPDNHLDLDTLAILEQALKKYAGALIVVSHAGDFMKELDIETSYSLVNGHLQILP